MNLLTSVTKGIQIVNELLEDFKKTEGKDGFGSFGPSHTTMMDEMMEFSRQGFDDEELLSSLMKGGSRQFM